MDLAELAFKVNTKELEDAATKVAELGTAVSKLNKPMQELTRESAKTNKELSKAEEAAAKASLAQAKLEQAQTKSVQATTKSSSVLERQNLILEYMAQGNSKGQASILATAKAAGALDDEMLQLNKTLVTQRTLIGGDPFDKSIGLMQKLQNEYKTTTEVTNLFNKNLGLTEKQMTDLAREKERLIALYGIEGKSLDGLSAEYDQLIQKSAMINQANDARTNSMKAQIKAQNDSARANEYLAKEMERVNRLNAEGESVTSASNNRLIKYEQALKSSGASASEAATRLAAYRNELLATQKAAGNRQVDYLSRALGPQITDIFVGLATGQAPLTILLQQGGQLRDQFALAGVAGAEMGDMLVKAAGSMITSIKDVGMAVGQVLVTAIVGTGKSITNFSMQITGANIALDALRAKIIATAGGDSTALKAFDLLGKSIVAFAGIITFTGIAALVAFGVAMADVIKEENALNRALNLTGAAMGVSLDAAYSAAKGMEEFGVSTGTALEVLTEMAKIGGMSADSLETVATTAKALKTAFDIPIADTVKKFKELQEKPTESLTKLAKELGTIPVEILKQVQAYEKAGDSIKAAELATKTYADGAKDAAQRTVNEFGLITRLGIQIAEIWDKTWESIMGYGRRDISKEIDTAVAEAERLRKIPLPEGADVNTFEAQQLENAERKVRLLKEEYLAQQNLAVERKANADAATKFESDNKKKAGNAKKETKELTDLEKERAQFLKVMSDLEDRASGFTKQYSDELNILNIGLTEGWLTQDQFNIKLQELNKVQPGIIKAHKDRADAIEKEIQAQKKADDALFDSLDVQHQLNMQILEQADLLALEGSLIGATDAQRKKALATKRLDLQLEKEIADIKKRPIPIDEQEAQIARARQRRLDAEKNLNTEIARDFAAEMQKQYDLISNGLTDAVIIALFDGGKAGSKKLRDLIVAELKKPITIVVKAVVDATIGSFMQGVMGGASSSAGSSILGSSIGNTAAAYGSSLFASNAVYGAAIGTTNIAAGSQAAMLASQTGAFGAQGAYATAQAAGTTASASQLAMEAGPYVLAAVAALNALGVFRSTKTVGGGITGTLGAGDLQSYDLTRKSGTLFNGPSYGVSSQGATEATIALDKAFVTMRDAITGTVDSLGFSTDKIKNFTMAVGDIKVHPDIAQLGLVLDGLSDEQKVAKINEVLTKSGNAMAELILGTGTTLEKLKSTFDFFYENFYSESEKFDNLTKDLTEAFSKLGSSLPKTRDQFKELVIAAQKAGDTSLLKGLLDLQYGFAELVPAAEELVPAAEEVVSIVDTLTETMLGLLKERAELEIELLQVQGKTEEANAALRAMATEGLTETELAAYDYNQVLRVQIQSYKDAQVAAQAYQKSLVQSTDNAFKVLQASVSAEKVAIDNIIKGKNQAISAARLRENKVRESISVLNTLFATLDKNIKDLYSEVGSSDFNAARKFITDSVLQAEKTGALPDNQKLSSAIDTVRTQLQKNQYTSKIDAERDRLRLVIELEALQSMTVKQLTAEEKMLKQIELQVSRLESQIRTLEAQKLTLDETLENAQQQIDVLREINISVISLEDALISFANAVSAERAAVAVTARASGGYTPAGMTLVGEKGPELVNFERPGMVYTAAQSAALMGGSSEELAAIRQELIMLRAETRAVVSNTSKAAKILDRSSPDGQSLQVTVVTA